MSFDLHEAVAAAVEASESPDPYVIAREVKIPLKELRGVVDQLLPLVVKERIRAGRTTAQAPVSAKWKDVREATTSDKWSYFTEDGWKFLADLTADDCRFIAEQYEGRAAANEAQAKHFHALADQLEREGVDTLGELEKVSA